MGGKQKERRKWRDRGPIDRLTIILRAIVFTAFGLIVMSIIWAGAYRFVEPPGTLVMLSRQASGATVVRQWTSLDDISPNLIKAVIAAEDTRFCLHNGFDFEAIDEALAAADNGGRLRGASTITQQTAKNVFLWNGRSWLRKGAEAWMTVLIETLWPKSRILEVYLNIAEWGDGLFGAEAAAQRRFGKSAKSLSVREAALLAAVLPNPHKWRVDPPGQYVQGRATLLQNRIGLVDRDDLARCVGITD